MNSWEIKTTFFKIKPYWCDWSQLNLLIINYVYTFMLYRKCCIENQLHVLSIQVLSHLGIY